MHVSELTSLVAYNDWANRRVLEAAARVPADRLLAPGRGSHDSVFGTLAHVLGTEWVWRLRCQDGMSPPSVPTAGDFPTFGALRARWGREASAWRGFVAALSDADLDGAVAYANTQGTRFETPLWQIVLHVVNHGTQFRAEAALLLTADGASPGNLDLIAYLRSPGSAPASA